MPDITSRQHSVVQAFKSAARGEANTALLDGWHLLHDAVDAAIDVEAVALTATPTTTRDAALLERLARVCDVFTVTTSVMDAMSPVRTPAGVVALARRKMSTVRDVLTPAPALVLVAADIQDPGNAGAIVRSAEAGGATGVLFAGTSADPWGWKALRAAMGSTFRLPTLRMSDPSIAMEELERAHLHVVATVPRGGSALHLVDLRRPSAIILGGEGQGLTEAWVTRAAERLTIPMKAPVESLNVAVAAALLVYEARRQREA